MLRDVAPAKINLFLHVLGRRSDGYHHLESLVTFADLSDELALEPDHPLGLDVEGPFGFGLGGDDNLVLKAARAFVAQFGRVRLGRFRLKKNLPVASGIGGGSSDAAAALRLLARLNAIDVSDAGLLDAARTLGADVPVCLDPSAPRLMHGIGHELGNRLHAFRYPAMLVNPGIPLETRAVFDRLGLKPGDRHAPASTPVDASFDGAFAMLESTRNDLEAPARALAGEIETVITLLQAQEGCRFARMSGSGATCFAIFDSIQAAHAAQAACRIVEPGWWSQSCLMKLPA
ncbi:IspE 4-diphosphocytidyl-2C-methyl-D-erythritol 2-phosphate synthase [Rhabdaerophilaceae bacterium]